jgi:hypothetical protein
VALTYMNPREIRAVKKAEREAQKRAREIARQIKDQFKLDAQAKAALEVQEFESRLEVLLSMHKQEATEVDWRALAVRLAAVEPPRFRANEMTAFTSGASEAAILNGRGQDSAAYENALAAVQAENAESERIRSLAQRILAHDLSGYTQALSEVGSFSEISDLGSSLHFTVHENGVVECVADVVGAGAIPSEVKALTSSGRLSKKAMPRGRFHEIYQDYVCGCLLRITREVFGILPVRKVIVTAATEVFDSTTGVTRKHPVVSVAFDRVRFSSLQFETLDPSDAVQEFHYRGEFKKTKKAETFLPIEPLLAAEVDRDGFTADRETSELLEAVAKRRATLVKRVQDIEADSDK